MLKKIEDFILLHSPYAKKIEVLMRNGYPFARIHPDFKALRDANIINIKEELRWYGVELYNLKADEDEKIRGYEIVIGEAHEECEPDDAVYKTLKSYVSKLTDKKIYPSSHLELHLGLDSLDYVELFIFIEKSFGVRVDEAKFSKMMNLDRLYRYIKEHYSFVKDADVKWDEVLNEDIKEELTYSPFIMFLYKTLMLPLFKLFFRIEIAGCENIPATACIIAPTHQSMLDGFLIEASLPYKILKNTFFIAYKQVFGGAVLDPIAKHGQSILIDANENLKETMQYCALPLKEGNNLVIFPEGARSRDRELLEFRPFFAMLSKSFELPIVPVLIDGSFEALRAGKIIPSPKKIRITYLKPIEPYGLNYHELAAKVKEALEDEIRRNPLYPSAS